MGLDFLSKEEVEVEVVVGSRRLLKRINLGVADKCFAIRQPFRSSQSENLLADP